MYCLIYVFCFCRVVVLVFVFFLMRRRPPRSTRTDTLFPYTTLFRSLQYLLGQGTSLGGARPKSTVRDTDGRLALGKFPSQADQRDVIRGEVLAMHLAAKAGVNVATTRVELINGKADAIIRRFDRADDGGRVPYMSDATMQIGRAHV